MSEESVFVEVGLNFDLVWSAIVKVGNLGLNTLSDLLLLQIVLVVVFAVCVVVLRHAVLYKFRGQASPPLR